MDNIDLTEEILRIVHRSREEVKLRMTPVIEIVVSKRHFSIAEKEGLIYYKDGQAFWNSPGGPVRVLKGM